MSELLLKLIKCFDKNGHFYFICFTISRFCLFFWSKRNSHGNIQVGSQTLFVNLITCEITEFQHRVEEQRAQKWCQDFALYSGHLYFLGCKQKTEIYPVEKDNPNYMHGCILQLLKVVCNMDRLMSFIIVVSVGTKIGFWVHPRGIQSACMNLFHVQCNIKTFIWSRIAHQ